MKEMKNGEKKAATVRSSCSTRHHKFPQNVMSSLIIHHIASRHERRKKRDRSRGKGA